MQSPEAPYTTDLILCREFILGKEALQDKARRVHWMVARRFERSSRAIAPAAAAPAVKQPPFALWIVAAPDVRNARGARSIEISAASASTARARPRLERLGEHRHFPPRQSEAHAPQGV